MEFIGKFQEIHLLEPSVTVAKVKIFFSTVSHGWELFYFIFYWIFKVILRLKIFKTRQTEKEKKITEISIMLKNLQSFTLISTHLQNVQHFFSHIHISGLFNHFQPFESCTAISATFSHFQQGESYIVLFHISQFDCFLFARDIRNLSMRPETCQAYHTVVWDLSAKYTDCVV